MSPRQWWWPAVVLASAVALTLLILLAPNGPLRPLVALWFLLVCPGVTLVRSLGVSEGLPQFVLGVAVSISLETAAGLLMAYAGVWSPGLLLLCLMFFCVVDGGYDLYQSLRPKEAVG
jgi:hypothetical protein